MKMRNNYVAIEPIYNDRVGDILIVTDYHPTKHVPVCGRVVSVPSTNNYKGDRVKQLREIGKKSESEISELQDLNKYSAEFDAPIEIKEGDLVWWSWKYWKEEDLVDGKFFLSYDKLIVAKREEDIIPLNGYVLVEPVEKPKEVNGVELAHTKKQINGLGTVRHLGALIRYRDSYHQDIDDIRVGDSIKFNATMNRSIEYKMHERLPQTLYYIQRKDIVAKKV